MSEEPVLIRRIEMYFDAERKPVKKIQDASFKYVTLYDEEGELTDQYRVEIVDGIDPELEEEATEEFREDEHPRDEDGQFADKGTGAKDSQSKIIRERNFNRTVGNHKERIETISKELEELNEMIKKEPDNTLRYRGLYLHVASAETRLKKAKQGLEETIERQNEFKKLDLFEINMGENTHKVGAKGFKNGAPKNSIKDYKVSSGKGNWLTVKETGRRVLESEWNNATKGKTIIESNISSKAEPKVLKLQEEVKYVWNELLSDKERSSVDILKIKYTDEPRWKKGRRGSTARTLGTHGERTVILDERMMMTPSILTVHLAYKDKRNDVLNTVAHELAHARWAQEVVPNKEKMKKFTDKVLSMGKENAVTEYAGSYFDDLEEIKKEDPKSALPALKRYYEKYGRKYGAPEQEKAIKNLEKEHNENINKAKQLIANETHSEYFGMVSSPSDVSYHNVNTEKLKAMSKMIKEDLYD